MAMEAERLKQNASLPGEKKNSAHYRKLETFPSEKALNL